MKRFLIVTPLILLALLALALIGPSFVDWNAQKGALSAEVKKQTGLNLTIDGDLSFAMLPYPRLSARDIRLTRDPDAQQILALRELEIGVQLLPLLSGALSVNWINLNEPSLTISSARDGTLNILTPELQQILAPTEKTPQNTIPSISVNRIGIQNGKISYQDQKGEGIEVTGINTELSMNSLSGPFKGQGSLLYLGQTLDFDLATQGLDTAAKTLPLALKAVIQPGGINLSFEGAALWADAPQAQGQLRLSVDALEKTLTAHHAGGAAQGLVGALALEGFLNLAKTGAQIKDIKASHADQSLSGAVDLTFAPFGVNGKLKTNAPLDVSRFMGPSAPVQKIAFDIKIEGSEGEWRVNAPSTKINDSVVSLNALFAVSKETNRPDLKLTAEGKSLALTNFVDKKGDANLEKTNNYRDILNQFIQTIPQANLSLAIKFEEISFQGQVAKSVSASARVNPHSLVLERAVIGSYQGASMTLSGGISDLPALKGMDIKGDIAIKDMPIFLKSVSPEHQKSWPVGLKAVNLTFKASGDTTALKTLGDISLDGGVLAAEANILTPLETPQIQGAKITAKHPNAARLARIITGAEQGLLPPEALSITTEIKQREDSSLAFEPLRLSLGASTISGALLLESKDLKPMISGDLSFDELTLGTPSAAPNNAPKQSARWSKEPLELSGLNALNADVRFSGKALNYGPWALRAPKGSVTLKDGMLNIANFTSGLFDGELVLSATLETAAQLRQPIHISLESKLSDVDALALLRALSGSAFIPVEGAVSGDISMKTSGLSPAALIYDLSGSGALNGRNIVLKGVDLERFAAALSTEAKPGDTALGLWKGASKGGETRFDTLSGPFTITEGIIAFDALSLDGPQAQILTQGKVDLPNWVLESTHKLTAKTKSEVPPFEMRFKGPLDNPAQTFGQGVLNDYLQRKAQRKIQGFVGDKILKKGLGDVLGLPQPAPQAAPRVEPTQPQPAEIAPAIQTTPEPVQEIQPQQVPEPMPAPEAAPPPPVEPVPENAPAQQAPQEEPKPEQVLEDVLKGVLQ